MSISADSDTEDKDRRVLKHTHSFSVLPELLAKLTEACEHLKSIPHDCNPCYSVFDIQWCITTMSEIDYKELFYETEDFSLEKQLLILVAQDELSQEVADHLSMNFRLARNKSYGSVCSVGRMSIRDERRHSFRKVNEYHRALTDDMKSLLSVGRRAQSIMDWLTENVDKWGSNIFQINKVTSRPLSTVLYIVMRKRNLFESVGVQSKDLVRYMFEIEDRYRPENPYHNSIHAADVVQGLHVMLSRDPLASNLTDFEIFVLLFAAAIHDVDHPAVSNQYLMKTKAPNAILYNDYHVNENHSLAVAFDILYSKEKNFLSTLSHEDGELFRQLVISLVIATDMTLHVKVTSAFHLSLEKAKGVNDFNLEHLKNVEERMDFMKGLLHFADIQNPFKPMELYQNWTDRIATELFAQGDLERNLNIPISPLCDRKKHDVRQLEIGFIDYIVTPLFEIVEDMFNCGDGESKLFGQQLKQQLTENRQFFNDPEGLEKKMSGARQVQVTSSIKFKTPRFYHIARRPELKWEVPGEDSEED